MRRRSLLLLLGALSTTTALLAAACSSDPAVGPLGGPGDPGTECFPAAQGRTVTDGLDSLQNTGKIPATVQHVTLTNPHGVTVTTRAWLVPIRHTHGDYDVIGDGFPYPPVTWGTWKQRRPARRGSSGPVSRSTSCSASSGPRESAGQGRRGSSTPLAGTPTP